MSILRRKGMTKAGFMLLRRPIVQMASSLISNTSSFSATNSACKFSAWARWASNRSSRDASTQYLMSGSAGEQGQEKLLRIYFYQMQIPLPYNDQLKHNCNSHHIHMVLPPFYLGRWFQQLAACWAHLQRPAQRSGWQRGHWSGGWRASRGVSRSEPPPSGFPCVHCLGSDRHSGAQTGWGSDLVKEPKS